MAIELLSLIDFKTGLLQNDGLFFLIYSEQLLSFAAAEILLKHLY